MKLTCVTVPAVVLIAAMLLTPPAYAQPPTCSQNERKLFEKTCEPFARLDEQDRHYDIGVYTHKGCLCSEAALFRLTNEVGRPCKTTDDEQQCSYSEVGHISV